MIRMIAFDADDTLWHNMPLFTLTQEKFRALLTDHDAPEEIGRRLFETEVRNLERYGYGIKGFTLSMIETVLELMPSRVTGEQIAAILALGKEMLSAPISLLEHAHDTITRLAPRYALMLLTKGDLFDQEAKLARSGLGELFQHVEIVSEKDPAAYMRIINRHNLTPQEFLMVGNSAKSDILPALTAGARAVYIPYQPAWAHEAASLDGADPEHYAELEHLGLLPSLLARWE